jgi:hypothetical protein
MRAFQSCVQERQQTIAQLQIFANDVFIVFAETPRLLIVAVNRVVITKERRQKTNLIRTHEELAVRATDETANITTHERLTRQAQ